MLVMAWYSKNTGCDEKDSRGIQEYECVTTYGKVEVDYTKHVKDFLYLIVSR